MRQTTDTPTSNAGGGSSGGAGSAGNSSGGAGSGGNSSGGAGAGGSNNVISSPVPTKNPTPSPQGGPYVVKQIQTLADEKISGEVCSITNAFIVNVTTPKVAFNFSFVPAGAERGKWTYAYSIPSAGESHDAHGDYTISQASTDGTLLVSMTGSDHVVFKGFDGSFPVHYTFDLVPSQNTGCPATP